MTNPITLTESVRTVLEANGFDVVSDVKFEGATYDLAAEDAIRLLFLVFRSDNVGWLDDFRDHQASLADTLSKVDLGRKWRDVYLIEMTSDPIDTDTEISISEAIESNTLVARKLIIDASSVDPLDHESVTGLLRAVLPAKDSQTVGTKIDVMLALRDRLIKSGFPRQLVTSMIGSFISEGSSLWRLALDHVT